MACTDRTGVCWFMGSRVDEDKGTTPSFGGNRPEEDEWEGPLKP